ncbi:MAG: hypothetical protein HYV53_03465 [Parcubacteria group bacterium]|nr:hypothetical protein [Parcubacteria group bacterium]
MSDFQQTVDLREKFKSKRKPPEPLEEIYETAAELKTISRPVAPKDYRRLWRALIFALAILVVGATVYSLFFRTKSAVVSPKAKDWYAVKLVNGEIFYGQVSELKADPVVLANVYYNYDQAKAKETGGTATERGLPAAEAGNLRLVKRGQETHGPAGTMDLVRSQVLFMEPLKSDSKVLKAILEYEK